MRIVIVGANGGTGRLATAQALAAGHRVAAVTRRPADFPLTHDALDVVAVDVHDEEQVFGAVAGADAVVSALGAPFDRQPITIYSGGVTNIIAAMEHHQVRRIVGQFQRARPATHADGGFMVNRVMQPLIARTIGRATYDDMLLMERLLAESDLDWTVVRPSGLFDAGRVSDFRLQEDHSDGIFTSRADLADCLVARAIDGEWCGKRVAVSTSEGAPTLWQMIRREAFVPFRSRSPRAAARPWRGPGRAPG